MQALTISTDWLAQLDRELDASDRACAVLSGAIVDDRLLRLLKKALLPAQNPKDDRLLGRGAPLDSFSSRTQLAWRLNLVAPEVVSTLDWLRDIRNDAAHKENFSFSQDRTRDRVANMLAALELRARAPALLEGTYATPKGNFVGCTVMLVARLQIEEDSLTQVLHTPATNSKLTITVGDT
jgi:hypothetical protein